MSASTTVTDPAEVNPCPSCGGTSGARVRGGASPRVRAWSCAACRTDWAIAVVNPQPYFDQLTATVERLSATRSVVRRIIALADDSITLSNRELRDRLTALTQACAR